MHDPTKVREWLELMLPAFEAGNCERSIEHTAGGAPRSGDEWPDPCALVGGIPPPRSVDELMTSLPNISADSDRQAAEWCFDRYFEIALWDVCRAAHPGIPVRAIGDVSISTRFPVLTLQEQAAEPLRRKEEMSRQSAEQRARKRAKRARYRANRIARGLPARSPGHHSLNE